MKAVVAAFNQEKALVGAFSVITNLRMQLFEALVPEEEHGDGVQRHLLGQDAAALEHRHPQQHQQDAQARHPGPHTRPLLHLLLRHLEKCVMNR